MTYLNYFFLLLIFVLMSITATLHAQSNVTKIYPISNEQVLKENDNIIVNYDVVKIGKRDRLITKITFDYDGEIIYPTSLSGNGIGKVKPGKDKKIIWNTIADGYELEEGTLLHKINPEIKRFGGGRSNALWGVFPLIGHKKVNTKDTQNSHLYTTVVAWSLVGSAVATKIVSNNIYQKYDDVYETPFHEELAQPHYNRANAFHKTYVGLLSSGILLMVAEGVMIYRKGANNDRELSRFDKGNKSVKKKKRKKKRKRKALFLMPQNDGLTFYYSLNF